jgi:hypothetical protein
MTEELTKENLAIERVMQAAYLQAMQLDPVDPQSETLHLLRRAFQRLQEQLDGH